MKGRFLSVLGAWARPGALEGYRPEGSYVKAPKDKATKARRKKNKHARKQRKH